ncbi:MAG: PAS domain S-box protein [Synechococcales cyanobacterium RM1_1_8]|nr:PAS domain S-box protein [Synechococcales cyanobacterium RM1_1_8]
MSQNNSIPTSPRDPSRDPSSDPARDPGKLAAELQHRVAFEALLTQISTEFVNLPRRAIDGALQDALTAMAEFICCDRACIFQYSPSGTEASCCQEWHRPGLNGFDDALRSILRHTFPWSLAQMLRQQTIYVPSLDDLPEEARPERRAAQLLQAQSYVVIPLAFRGQPLGWLAFYGVYEPKRWTPEDLDQLRAFGSIVAGVMARQRAEAALQESEAKFEQLVENLQQIFFIYQAEPYQLIYTSPAYEAIWGMPAQRLYDDPHAWLASVHPADRDRVIAETERRRTQGLSINLEYRIIHPDGSVRWIHSRASPIADAGGQIYRIAGIAEDVSDRHRYAQALARSEEKFSKAFRFNPLPMAITVMATGEYLEVNDAFCLALGCRRQEVIGRIFWQGNLLIAAEQLQPIREQLRCRGSFQNLELHVRRRNGQLCIAQVSGMRMDVDGQAQVLSIAQDITEARQQEIQRQQVELTLRQATLDAQVANRAKGDFLAMISHEIRTPLNAILGLASLLLEDGLTPAQQRNLRMISGGAEELLTILNDILDLSKIEARRLRLEQAPFNWTLCLRDVVALFRPQARAKQLSLKVVLAPQLPSQIVGDSQRLRQILKNLLNNAIKFTERGEVQLSVQAQESQLLFCIGDTGIGIDRDSLERLLEPFSQADSSVTRKYGGTGLGLTICDRLLEQMGGTLWFESRGELGGRPPPDWLLQGDSALLPTASLERPWRKTAAGRSAAGASSPAPAKSPAPGSRFYFTLPCQPALPEAPRDVAVGLASDGSGDRLGDRSSDCSAVSPDRSGSWAAIATPSSLQLLDELSQPPQLQALLADLLLPAAAGAEEVAEGEAGANSGPREADGAAVYAALKASPILDLSTFEQVRDWCEDAIFFESLLATYSSDASTQLEALELALGRRDGGAISDLAHRLGIASATLGGLRLALLCRLLAGAIAPAPLDWGLVGAIAATLRAEYQAVVGAIVQQSRSSNSSPTVGQL